MSLFDYAKHGMPRKEQEPDPDVPEKLGAGTQLRGILSESLQEYMVNGLEKPKPAVRPLRRFGTHLSHLAQSFLGLIIEEAQSNIGQVTSAEQPQDSNE